MPSLSHAAWVPIGARDPKAFTILVTQTDEYLILKEAWWNLLLCCKGLPMHVANRWVIIDMDSHKALEHILERHPAAYQMRAYGNKYKADAAAAAAAAAPPPAHHPDLFYNAALSLHGGP